MRPDDFDHSVRRPPGLSIAELRRAADYVERELSELVDIYFEQKNVFSAIVGIYGARALDNMSVYEKDPNRFTAAQRFPDLRRRGAPEPLRPEDSLESKASIRPWALQAHYDHAGWYVVWRYLVDTVATYEADRQVIIWRIDLVFLTQEDWKYERSSASAAGGGRTHTFGLIKAASRLRDAAVYSRSDVTIRGSKPVPVNGDG